MNLSKQNSINKLASRIIEVSKTDGSVDSNKLKIAIEEVKKNLRVPYLFLLKLLIPKLKKELSFQTALVTSASKLDPKTTDDFHRLFSRLYKRSVAIENIINPNLIAGVQVKIGDDLYDASVRESLKILAKSVK